MHDYELDLLSGYHTLDQDAVLSEAQVQQLVGSSDPQELFRLLRFGVWCLREFVRLNFVGPSINDDSDFAFSINDQTIAESLSLNGEPAYALCKSPVLLHLAVRILVDSESRKVLASTAWWASRTCWIWQHLFVDRSAKLRDIHFDQFAFLDQHFSTVSIPVDLRASYALERARVFGYYYEPERASVALEEALTLTRLNTVQLTGVLGRRTKFQVKDVAQLALEDLADVAEMDGTDEAHHSFPSMYPIDCALNDDTLLEKTQFTASIPQRPLSSMQECTLLAFLDNLRQTHSTSDDTLKEVERAYLDRLLHHPTTYACKYIALIRRCRLETDQSRRVERALAQAEQLAKEFGSRQASAPVQDRLRYVFTTNVPPIWEVRKMEAGLLMSLGCTSEAMRIFIDLRLWDETVDCYRRLGMLDRAEALVREQLETKETPHLWCLLGDIVDDEAHYLKAWTLSGQRLARAQSSLGMLYFVRKRYEEAVKAFETALAILPLDLKSWYALGYCAMQIKNYDRASQAYRRCTTIDPDSFEAWNNLAACLVHLGDKDRAFSILLESVKCNYENWKVWENFVHLAIDTGHFREAITGVNRLIDLKSKYEDAQVLDVLARVASDKTTHWDLDEHFLKDLRTLFGRITSKVVANPAIWRAYSELYRSDEESPNVDDLEKYVGLLQKAHQSAIRETAWIKNDEEIRKILDNVSRLASAQLRLASLLEPSDRSKQIRASARLAVKGVLASLSTSDGGEREAIRDDTVKLKEMLEKIENS